ncbi:hypothetical protein FQA39_LY11697 [Lamprigera yunnana]|nr:hypothetical protein FQA39_LY11697 [Lamprigera yunnana]
MDLDVKKSSVIKSEVIVNETFLFSGQYQDYGSEEMKLEPVDFKISFKCKEEDNHAEHRNMYSVPVQYFCNDCTYKTQNKSYLKRNVQIHTSDEYKCKECDYKTLRKCNLLDHIKFITKYNLKDHVKSHTGVEYKCNECDYQTW